MTHLAKLGSGRSSEGLLRWWRRRCNVRLSLMSPERTTANESDRHLASKSQIAVLGSGLFGIVTLKHNATGSDPFNTSNGDQRLHWCSLLLMFVKHNATSLSCKLFAASIQSVMLVLKLEQSKHICVSLFVTAL